MIFLDDDQAIESPNELRTILAEVPSSVAALLTPLVSSRRFGLPTIGAAWWSSDEQAGISRRYFPDSHPDRSPCTTVSCRSISSALAGSSAWTGSPSSMTVEYASQTAGESGPLSHADPDGQYNCGVPYDEGSCSV